MSAETIANRYFTLNDDTSSKFWEISVGESSYTVNFGRIGTSGQSQTKNFETPEACRKAAHKVIQEKVNKGYVEDGIDTQSLPTATAKSAGGSGAGKAAAKQTAEAEVLQGYQSLLDADRPDELLPFL